MPITLSLPDQPFIWTKKGRKLVQMGLNMLKMSRFLHLENTFSSLIEAFQRIPLDLYKDRLSRPFSIDITPQLDF